MHEVLKRLITLARGAANGESSLEQESYYFRRRPRMRKHGYIWKEPRRTMEKVLLSLSFDSSMWLINVILVGGIISYK
jgi:hypothetical protein